MLLLLGLALAPAAGAQAAAPLSGTAEVLTNQLGALTRTSPRGAMETAQLFFRDGALRIHFRDNAGGQYALVLPEGASVGWIIGADGGSMPVPRMHWPLRFDADAPCTGLGMFADCQRVENGVYAGRNAVHWRYRLPNPTGPGMTRQGNMWLDAETGLVLSYEGRTGVGREQRWEVRRLRYVPQPAELFDPPPEATAR
ncbi:hypothetical protein Psesu_3076 [Pseudoxanthomonas suwonensis 11-1]|uniref:Secreted protein n=2 Tax=Pseudoxanthomonas suwonensis TaxID=314722 RepID=E6WXN3_PSEUU|nr:hypothetical protein Psesu_3076 [Pseudoxanthomonas suwonensis 11-1]